MFDRVGNYIDAGSFLHRSPGAEMSLLYVGGARRHDETGFKIVPSSQIRKGGYLIEILLPRFFVFSSPFKIASPFIYVYNKVKIKILVTKEPLCNLHGMKLNSTLPPVPGVH